MTCSVALSSRSSSSKTIIEGIGRKQWTLAEGYEESQANSNHGNLPLCMQQEWRSTSITSASLEENNIGKTTKCESLQRTVPEKV